MDIFGFRITRKSEEEEELKNQPKSFVPPSPEDGSVAVAAGGYYGQYLDLDGDAVKTDIDLIKKYRITAEQPECDTAIDDIVNESIVADDDLPPVAIELDDLEQPNSIKNQIREEFDNVLELLNFGSNGQDIFRRWYVDGRLYYHMIVDEKKPKEGLIEVRPIDALRIRKVREIEELTDPVSGAKIPQVKAEYYVYQDAIFQRGDQGLKINKEAVCYIHSGLMDSTRKKVLSPLHKAIKPVNQLRMMEDSLVIYRLSRAPERRIFYIDVGNLPKGKAEEYMRSIMNQYRNKLVYDAQSGEIRDDRKHMSILEDFWLPRREGGRGTEITTLPGGDNLGQIDDIIFFQKKLYRALNVPVGRLESENGFNLGRSSEITREELKFQKMINRLRRRFSTLFFELLYTQLLLKGVITKEDWPEMREQIRFDFRKDSFFAESKDNEILAGRINMLNQLQPFIGKYYSNAWVRKNVLRLSDDDIEQMDAEIAEEPPPEGMVGPDGMPQEQPPQEITNVERVPEPQGNVNAQG